jgi:hypothetical protein
VNIANDEKIQPDNVVFNNSTKFGVDVFLSNDQTMFRKPSFKRVWSLKVFFNIVDIATISAWIFYKELTGKEIRRQNFVVSLADELQQECIMPKRSATVL